MAADAQLSFRTILKEWVYLFLALVWLFSAFVSSGFRASNQSLTHHSAYMTSSLNIASMKIFLSLSTILVSAFLQSFREGFMWSPSSTTSVSLGYMTPFYLSTFIIRSRMSCVPCHSSITWKGVSLSKDTPQIRHFSSGAWCLGYCWALRSLFPAITTWISLMAFIMWEFHLMYVLASLKVCPSFSWRYKPVVVGHSRSSRSSWSFLSLFQTTPMM